ncbi:lysozyme inhibitor LprI family protein [Falsibacillus pallidus]|uniref:Uncharacterized protein YecT (DUF1311 family) n=1 Tax=Falsibacillus pallidus TaxID=493781 RepID=A0A370GB67_9BACI|nr:lysozyme inhibitor LprI family protein [Falsibacillus pallidus]RDI41008.1 uncharacterized protein YecT (DUF1311 family) [Falsibacillus pallidus]
MKKSFIGMAMVLILLLAACGNSSEKSNEESDNQQKETQSAENTNPPEDNEKNDTTEQTEKDSSANTGSLKEDYLKKLNEAKKETEEMRKNPTDSSTYALKNIEGNLFDKWDGLLNEIYQVLIKQLPSDKMDQVRKEQREWIKYRDKTAKEASLKYKGGTQEQLEYVAVENNLTADRCFELVEKYMK